MRSVGITGMLALAAMVALVGCATRPGPGLAVTLGPVEVVADPGVAVYPWFPDGHVTWLPDGRGGHQMYWAGSSSHRSTGPTLAGQRPDPAGPVLTPGPPGSASNGGAWLMSVFRIEGDRLIGFAHVEDHEFLGTRSPDGTAWKSMAVCRSGDDGVTWTVDGVFLTAASAKPAAPRWGGVGDGCVVRDDTRGRWVCFFQDHTISAAVSDDPGAAPGTWRKWDGRDFTAPGLGGTTVPLAGLSAAPGGNPSVHFNRDLARWVMVWHTWDGVIVLATSPDLITWTGPQVVVTPPPGGKCWYPTILGDSDVTAGAEALLVYGEWPDAGDWRRRFVVRRLHLAATADPVRVSR